VAVSPVTGDVYVTNSGSPTMPVMVIDPTTNHVIHTMNLLQARGVAVSPTGTFAGDVYVSYDHNGLPAVAVINPATSAVTTISLPPGNLGQVAVSPVTGDVYVTDPVEGTLSVIS
jgi:YVTN family beta-propeller protein